MDSLARQQAVEQACRGDREALERLLESFRPYVRVVVRAIEHGRLCRRVDDSDLVQDALLEAHQSFGSFRGRQVGEFAAWIRRIAIRSVGRSMRHHLETDKRAVAKERPLEHWSDVEVGASVSPSALAVRNEHAARVASWIDGLPEDMQQVVLGRHLDGLSYADLAERLGRTNDAVRALYTRALRRLREQAAS